MKREDDRKYPLKADALRGFFEFVNGIFFKWIKGKNAHWKQVIMIFILRTILNRIIYLKYPKLTYVKNLYMLILKKVCVIFFMNTLC